MDSAKPRSNKPRSNKSGVTKPRPAGPPPSRSRLQEAALRHLTRYAATEAGLTLVLDRRIDRWARLAATEGEVDPAAICQAKQAAREVTASLVEAGAVNDAAFAEARARRLTRAGRSSRAVGAHLAARGVNGELAQSVLPNDPERELAAALVYAKKRRLGPFRNGDEDLNQRRREIGAMARAGFGHGTVERAMDMDLDEALTRVLALKAG